MKKKYVLQECITVIKNTTFVIIHDISVKKPQNPKS